MKRIGIIDNLVDIQRFTESKYHACTAAEVMAATGGNTGNVAFVFGIRQLIKNPISRVEWSWAPETVKERFDHLVICCANQLGSHTDLGGWADRLEQFGLPVTLVGLGAQSDNIETDPVLPDGTKHFLEYVKSQHQTGEGSNISVRGKFTQRVLENLNVPSEPAGCPSLLISAEHELGKEILLRQQRSKNFKRVAVAAGNPWHGPSAALEETLVNIVNQFNGEYILQHPESMLQVAYGEREKIPQKTIDRFLEVYASNFNQEEMFEWFRHNSCAFIDAPNWMRFISKFDFMIGPRYHGVALAIQAKVPGCVITIDSRTHELCEGTTIKSIPLSEAIDLTSLELIEKSRWSTSDAEAFDRDRLIKARTYSKFLESNDIEPSDHLKNLCI